jgi:hypothetical protein
VDAGDIRVTGTEADTVDIVHVARGPAGSPRLDRRVQDGVLVVEGRCALLSLCTVDIELTVPAGLPVDLQTGNGDVEVDAMDAAVRVEIGDGDLVGRGLGGDALHARIGWGDVGVAVTGEPVDLTLDLARGDVRLTVPAGVYELDLAAFDGVSTYGVADGSGPRLHVRTQAGRAEVNGI